MRLDNLCLRINNNAYQQAMLQNHMSLVVQFANYQIKVSSQMIH